MAGRKKAQFIRKIDSNLCLADFLPMCLFISLRNPKPIEKNWCMRPQQQCSILMHPITIMYIYIFFFYSMCVGGFYLAWVVKLYSKLYELLKLIPTFCTVIEYTSMLYSHRHWNLKMLPRTLSSSEPEPRWPNGCWSISLEPKRE